MSEKRTVTVVIEQTIEHRVPVEVDVDDVLAWAVMDAPPGTPIPSLTGRLVHEWIEAGGDDFTSEVEASTQQEPLHLDVTGVIL